MIRSRDFVGRHAELATIERAVDDARRGAPRFVLLTGEPGIGKTSLAIAAAERAEASGARVASGRAWEGGGAPAFWLWRECLRELGGDVGLPSAILGDEARFAALEAVADRVRAAANERLVVLLLDDLQWSDVPSLLAAKLLARTVRSERLCVVATIREPTTMPDDVASVVADLRRESIVVPVRGLGRDELAALAQGSGVTGDAAIDALALATGGNPLFAVEVLADDHARRELDRGRPVPTPHYVRDVLERHLARLPAEHRSVVAWAAVCGEPIDPASIAAAGALDAADVDAAVEAACRERVLSRAAGTIRFSHDLLRTAAYEAVPFEARARMHDAFARALGARDPDDPRVVRHLFEAAPHAADADAAGAALRAARTAMRRLAYEDAARFADRAVAVYERTSSRADLARALAVLAEALFVGDDLERSAAAAERAVEVARGSGDADAFARAALALGLRRTMGRANAPLAALLDDARARLEAAVHPDVGLRCAVEARLAAALQPLIDPPRALALARRAIESARESGDPEILARTLHAARPAFRMLEPLDERSAMDRELSAIAERLGDRPLAAHAYARAFWCAVEAGDGVAADTTLASLEALADRLHLANHELAARAARSVRASMQGRFGEAEAIIASVESTRERWEPAGAAALPIDPVALLRVSLAAARGDPLVLPEAPREIAPLLAVYESACNGRFTECASAFPAVADPSLQGEVSYSLRMLLADACGRAGIASYADRLYELCLPFEGRHHVWTPLPGYTGSIDRILGALANVRGDRTAALRHYDAAIAMEERLGAVAFAARSRAERARLAPPSARVDPPVRARPAIVREGDTWLVTFGGESTRVKDMDGMRYLAYLVARPDTPVPAVELFGERAAAAGDAGEVLDRAAIASYRARARELRERLEEAEARNDRGAVEGARRELEALEAELSRAVGLGGRPRRAASEGERIRVNVTMRIRKAIQRLRADAPLAARHLDAAVRTGVTCSYEPP